MCHLILFLTALIFLHEGVASSLIFVHLGKKIPNCLFSTLRQARYFNPELEVYLLTDSSGIEAMEADDLSFFQEEEIELIDMEKVPKAKLHTKFLQVYPLDCALSNGLWLYALERFFYLYDFIQTKELETILHLENDVMLYMNFEELLPCFQKCGAFLAAPFLSKEICIPSIFFIQNKESLEPFLEHVLSRIQSHQKKGAVMGINDMSLLASYHQTSPSKGMMALPTLMKEYNQLPLKKGGVHSQDQKASLSFLSLNGSYFENLIFDAATLGIYINGRDPAFFPENGAGTVDRRSLFNPRLFSYFWSEDKDKRPVPYLRFRDREYRIVNLHFHSKKTEEYTSYKLDRLALPMRNVE